jgi:hypothetical protein
MAHLDAAVLPHDPVLLLLQDALQVLVHPDITKGPFGKADLT